MEEVSSDNKKTDKKEIVTETRQNGVIKHYMNPSKHSHVSSGSRNENFSLLT